MPRMSSEDAVSTIRFLSLCLHNFALPNDDLQDASKAEKSQLRRFSHLATMLNTGSPRSLVTAVTGKVTVEGISITVVISSNSSDKTKNFEEKNSIVGVKPSKMTWEGLPRPSP